MNFPNYCTLFDSYYLSRGLALYESLCNTHDDFRLYIFAFDERSKDILEQMKLDKAIIIGLKEFEDEELLRVKPTRTKAEYCFTCTPSIIKYSIEKYNLPSCTYLDADLYFYSNSSVVFEELSSYDIGLSPHNYSAAYDMSKDSGKYCVQFVYFKNTPEGMEPLTWWRNECIKWCFARIEDGKYGDQKYLDSFPSLFKNVYVTQHPGIGVAPWNIQDFNFSQIQDKVILYNDHIKDIVIFYHYQNLKIDFDKKTIHLGKWYDISDNVAKLFYTRYIERLLYFENIIRDTNFKSQDFKIIKESKLSVLTFSILHKVINGNEIVRSVYNYWNKWLKRTK